jgi:hypothetical protein
MRLTVKSRLTRLAAASWTAGLFVILSSSAIVLDRLPMAERRSLHESATAGFPDAIAPPPLALPSRVEVKNYFMGFAGDHSLDAATVVEQASAGYAKYTVQLRLASGVEQSVVVAAPAGGLQIEMHDMTGDHVANDVVLRPALLQSLPTVLVNDGHDHFAVVASATASGTCSSREGLASRERDAQTFAFLRSFGFRVVCLPQGKRLLIPRQQRSSADLSAQDFIQRLGHTSTPSRAPPVLIAV